MRALLALSLLVGCATTQKKVDVNNQSTNVLSAPYEGVLLNQESICAQRRDLCSSVQSTSSPVQSTGPFMPR